MQSISLFLKMYVDLKYCLLGRQWDVEVNCFLVLFSFFQQQFTLPWTLLQKSSQRPCCSPLECACSFMLGAGTRGCLPCWGGHAQSLLEEDVAHQALPCNPWFTFKGIIFCKNRNAIILSLQTKGAHEDLALILSILSSVFFQWKKLSISNIPACSKNGVTLIQISEETCFHRLKCDERLLSWY